MRKSGLTAFFLGFIPGMGHMYLRKFGRAFIYPFVIAIIFVAFLMMSIADGGPEIALIGLFICLVIWLISIIDLVTMILKHPLQFGSAGADSGQAASVQTAENPVMGPNGSEYGSGTTIALAFIPGLGHMHMGLMYRGLTFLIGFFGIMTMVFFVTAIAETETFLIFLGALPILWVYNLFDAMQLYHRKNRGETLVDRTIFEELMEQRDHGKKSKMLAMLLSLLPGAGHMYLGLQRRGLQLMIAFLFSIYILDVLHLSLFLFLIPILWFYSFFDSLQQAARYEQGAAVDTPIVEWLVNHQKWVGIGLLVLGAYYILDRVAVPLLYEYFPSLRYRLWYERYFQTTIVSLVLIIGGFKLLSGSKKNGGGRK